jgi:hypothetical protein
MARKSEQAVGQYREALNALYRRYRHRANATGFDIGYRWTEGKPTKDICVRIHVTAKIPEEELSERELFPEEIENVPVDVMTGPYEAKYELGTGGLDDTAAILSGTACRRASGGMGTIGAVAIDERSGRVGILSNWHVLATYRGAPGDLIYDAGSVSRPIARLSQSILSRQGDAAFAPFEGRQTWLPTVRELNLNLAGVRTSRLGEVLCKYGRSTGLTRARVDGEGIYRIIHSTGPSMWSPVEIEGFRLAPEDPDSAADVEISSPGDSGACWVSPTSGEVTGLHMAGEGAHQPNEEYALACNMPSVLHRLGLRLATVDDLVRVGMVAASDAPEFLASAVANSPEALTAPRVPSSCPCCGRNAPDWSGFAPRGLSAAGAVAEALPLMSVSGNIWQAFLDSLRRRYPQFADAEIGIDDDARDYFTDGDLSALMRDIILKSARFERDGAIPTLQRLRPEIVFRRVCIAIGEEYRRLGYPVTA